MAAARNRESGIRALGRTIRKSAAVATVKRLARWPRVQVLKWRDRRATCRHYLAICAIFKDEARFLDEWLEFHAGVGVGHFYLYNNFSSDDYRVVLQPWIDRGLVTLTDWPVEGGQLPAYAHCLPRAKAEARWLVLMDIDEFLFSPRDPDLRAVLRDYETRPVIYVYWHVFGSSGHVTRPANPSVIESYLRRAVPPAISLGKSIINPRLTRHIEVHLCSPVFGEPVDEKGARPAGYRGSTAPATWDVLCMNHYWSKSIEDLREKVVRGFPLPGFPPRDLDQHLRWEREMNSVEDRAILPLWEMIKSRRSPAPRP